MMCGGCSPQWSYPLGAGSDDVVWRLFTSVELSFRSWQWWCCVAAVLHSGAILQELAVMERHIKTLSGAGILGFKFPRIEIFPLQLLLTTCHRWTLIFPSESPFGLPLFDIFDISLSHYSLKNIFLTSQFIYVFDVCLGITGFSISLTSLFEISVWHDISVLSSFWNNLKLSLTSPFDVSIRHLCLT